MIAASIQTRTDGGSKAHNKTPAPKVKAAIPIVFPMHLIKNPFLRRIKQKRLPKSLIPPVRMTFCQTDRLF